MWAMLRPVEVVIRDEGFLLALSAGVVGALVAVAARRAGTELGAAGIATVATLVGLLLTGRGSSTLVGALALLAASGRLTARRATVWQIAGSAPGALLLVTAISSVVAPWMRIAAGGATILLAPSFGALDHRFPRLTGLLVAVSAVGVLGATPDTEHARALAGGSLGAAPVSADRRSRPGPAGAAAFAGLLAWTAAVDGFARPGAVVGALACAGVFALAPVVAWAGPPATVVTVVHLGLVGIASRVAGFEQGAWSALLIVLVAVVGATAVLGVAGSRARGQGRRGPSA
jgi:hypothetical protein